MFGLIDCNNFYVSCERVFRPELRGKPVVILSNNDGCLISLSNEAKAMQIPMGLPFYQLKPLLASNGVTVFSSNYALYGDMSSRVMNIVNQLVPISEIYSIDESFLDFHGFDKLGDLSDYAHHIVRSVERSTGIPVSLGIASTRTLAKMASKFAKKYPAYKGACLIDTDEKREKALKLLDISDVWGVGRRMRVSMEYYGIKTAWDFAQKSASWVRDHFTVTGLRTWKELHGQPCITPDGIEQKKSIYTSRSFPKTLSSLELLKEPVANFAASCARKLRQQHSCCQAIDVFAQTNRCNQNEPQYTLRRSTNLVVPTQNTAEIISSAMDLLQKGWLDGYRFKRAGILVWGLVPEDEIQTSFFDTVDRLAQRRLQNVVDSINHKNGDNKIKIAAQGFSTEWHLRKEYISHQYTTNFDDLLTVRAKD